MIGVQHVWFYLNHFSGRVYIGKPCNNTWFQFQVSGITHIISSPWMDWFHGGLSHYIEHHMIPSEVNWVLLLQSPTLWEEMNDSTLDLPKYFVVLNISWLSIFSCHCYFCDAFLIAFPLRIKSYWWFHSTLIWLSSCKGPMWKYETTCFYGFIPYRV